MSEPLHNHEMERAASGALLYESETDLAAARVAIQQHPLTEDDFHNPAHWLLWLCVSELLAAGQPADCALVSERLKAKSPEALERVGGIRGLLTLTSTGTLNIHTYPGHVRQLRELGLRRRMVSAAEAVLNAARHDEDPNEALSAGASAWAQLANQTPSTLTGRQLLERSMHKLDEAQAGRLVAVVPTGIDLYDQVVGGFQADKVNVIMAQPGTWKTALVATAIRNIARRFHAEGKGHTVGLFSSEDTGDAFTDRWLADEAAVPLKLLGRVKLYPPQMRRIAAATASMWEWLPSVVCDQRSLLTGAQLVQTAREWVMTKGTKVIVVDHFGKLDHQAKDHHRDDLARAHTMNHLCALAKDHHIPVVIVVHDKSRDGDARYKRPTTTGAAGSAAVERDARVQVGTYVNRDTEKEEVWIAVLKQTVGEAGDDFALRLRAEAGLVESTGNGTVDDSRTHEQETRMLARRSAFDARLTGERTTEEEA